SAEDAIEIAKYDDAGNYRPLKTAPNLRHGWRLELDTLEELRRALDYFYAGRLAVFAAWKSGKLQTTPLRETLNRQSGMYRIAAKISDTQIDNLVSDFCRSNGGCLRTILCQRAGAGALAWTECSSTTAQSLFPEIESSMLGNLMRSKCDPENQLMTRRPTRHPLGLPVYVARLPPAPLSILASKRCCRD